MNCEGLVENYKLKIENLLYHQGHEGTLRKDF